jgi:hypothetical protein
MQSQPTMITRILQIGVRLKTALSNCSRQRWRRGCSQPLHPQYFSAKGSAQCGSAFTAQSSTQARAHSSVAIKGECFSSRPVTLKLLGKNVGHIWRHTTDPNSRADGLEKSQPRLPTMASRAITKAAACNIYTFVDGRGCNIYTLVDWRGGPLVVLLLTAEQ